MTASVEPISFYKVRAGRSSAIHAARALVGESEVKPLVAFVCCCLEVMGLFSLGHASPFLLSRAETSLVPRYSLWIDLDSRIDPDIKGFRCNKQQNVPADDPYQYLVAGEVEWSIAFAVYV